MKITEMFDRKYLGRVAAFVFGITAAVALLIYAGSHFLKRFSNGLELTDARLTTVTDTVSADAFIMRSETPVYSTSAGGSVVPEVHDGTHISLGGIIARVYSDSDPEAEERLDEIDGQIALFEKNAAEERSVNSTVGVDREIYDTLGSMRFDAERGDYADVLSMRTNMLIGIKKREIMTGEITDYAAQIKKLGEEKARLTARLGKCLETVSAAATGYYFSSCDGYGDVFSADRIDTITFGDFEKMISAEPESTAGVVGTLVTDFNWYIACMMKKTEAGVLDSMGRCDVRFTYSGVTITMNVRRVIPENGGERAVVILRSGKIPTGFDYTRTQPVEISCRTYTGFKLPKSAVRVVDGYEGVYILDEVTIEFRRINIIYDDGVDVICTGESTGDDIVIINENNADAETDGEKKEYPFIRQNDIVVVSGTDLHSGKVMG